MKQLPDTVRVVGPAARLIVQTVLAAPVYFFSMFAWIPLASAFSPGGGTFLERLWSCYFGLSAISGLVCLPCSVFSTVDWMRASRKRRVLISTGLALGCSLAVLFLGAVFFERYPNGNAVLRSLVFFGGPFIVAIWNLFRIWKRVPNHSPEPSLSAVH